MKRRLISKNSDSAAHQPSDGSHKIAVDEIACANSISMSVHWLRKDRRGARRIPFYRLGDRILYDLDRVRASLLKTEEGGSV